MEGDSDGIIINGRLVPSVLHGKSSGKYGEYCRIPSSGKSKLDDGPIGFFSVDLRGSSQPLAVHDVLVLLAAKRCRNCTMSETL